MISNSRKMNSEINVKEIFWRFFEQWKAVLLFSLVAALFITGLKYVLDTNTYKEKATESEIVVDPTDIEGSVEEVLSGLPEADRMAVEKLMKEKALLDVRKDYYDNSLVFHMDPAECRLLRLQYEVKTEKDSDKGTLIDAYKNSLISEASVTSLGEVIAPEIDTKYIYELFTSAGYGDTEKGITVSDERESLVISMLLPEDTDADAVKTVITDLLNYHKKDMTVLIAEHEIKLISDEIVQYPAIELAQEQNSILTTVNTAQTNYNKSYAELSEQQRKAYNIIAALLTADSFELPASETSKPGISKKTFAGGFILGAFIYGAILGLILLLRRRIISPEDTLYYPNVNDLFEFNNYIEKKGLLNSGIVSKLRRRNRMPLEDQVNACVDEISLICSSNKLNKVTFISPGNMSEKCDAVIKEVCSKLTLDGIDVSIMETASPDMEVEKRELAESTPVIPVIVEDKTKLDGFNSLMNLCDYLNCDVMGTIYYGER